MSSGVDYFLFFLFHFFCLCFLSSLASGSLRCPFGVMRDGPHVGKIRSRDPPWHPWLHFLLNFCFQTWLHFLLIFVFQTWDFRYLCPKQLKFFPFPKLSKILMVYHCSIGGAREKSRLCRLTNDKQHNLVGTIHGQSYVPIRFINEKAARTT